MPKSRNRKKNNNTYLHDKLTKEERLARKQHNAQRAAENKANKELHANDATSDKSEVTDRITKYKLKYMSNKDYDEKYNRHFKPSQNNSVDFNFTHIHGLKLTKMPYACNPVVYDVKSLKNGRKKTKARAEFKDYKVEFLKHIGKNHIPELKRLGLRDKQIETIAEGHSINGYNVHHKLPLHGGGTNDFSNFIFMPMKEHDDIHKHVIDKQIEGIKIGETREVLIPWSDSPVFEPPAYPKPHENTKDWGVINNQKYRSRNIKPDKTPIKKRKTNDEIEEILLVIKKAKLSNTA